MITCRAAVSWAANEPLKIEEIQVDPPKRGEVRVKIIASGIVSHRGQFVPLNDDRLIPVSLRCFCDKRQVRKLKVSSNRWA